MIQVQRFHERRERGRGGEGERGRGEEGGKRGGGRHGQGERGKKGRGSEGGKREGDVRGESSLHCPATLPSHALSLLFLMRLKIAHAPSLMSSILFPSLMSSILFPSLMSSILFPSLMSSILFPSLMSSILFPSLMSSILFPSLMSSILFPSLPPLFHPSRCTLPVFSQQNRIPLLDPPFPHSPFPPPPPPATFSPLCSCPQHTWERAKLAQTLDRVVVATDDERIASCCQGFGAEVIMTSAACGNGSERCAEAVERLKGQWDVVVNIQGDEPLIDPATIDAVVIALQEAPEAVAATAVADIKASAAPDPNRVKCVVDSRGFALYFSRALIPHNRDGVPHPGFPYMLHLGLQAYDAAFLARYKASEAGRLEEEEQLEQLRILEQGCNVKVVKVAHSAHGVDVPADVKRIEDLLLRGGR
ncbi:unnamed protein product [Closterium sp. NIES-64]|nr:unnamed protein product [Closterium sp. NIES-64]